MVSKLNNNELLLTEIELNFALMQCVSLSRSFHRFVDMYAIKNDYLKLLLFYINLPSFHAIIMVSVCHPLSIAIFNRLHGIRCETKFSNKYKLNTFRAMAISLILKLKDSCNNLTVG